MRFADGEHRTPYDGDYNNLQPRVGLAYALNSKTSIRAAWGLFYVVSRHTVKGEVGTAFGFTDTSIPWTLDSGRTQYATLSNPFPVGLTYPPGRDAIFVPGTLRRERPCRETTTRSTSNGPSPSSGKCRATVWWRRTTSAPRARTCSLGRADVVSELDPLAPTYWGMGRNTLTSLVQNPFYGIITNPASTSYNQPTIQLNRLLRPYAAYTSVGGYRASRNIANSIYHAMTIKYEKRFSRGLSVVAHYTISKMLSDSDVSGSRRELHRGRLEHSGLLQPAQRAFALRLRCAAAAGGELRLPVAARPRPDIRQEHEPRPGRRDRRLGGERDHLGRVRARRWASRNPPARCGSAASVRIRSAIPACRERCATS